MTRILQSVGEVVNEAGHWRLFVDNREAVPSIGQGIHSSREVRVALRLIEARYAEPLTLRTLAGAIGCSREHLARRFRRETGITVHRHLVHVRVTRAAHEVRRGDKIEAVMLGVGFRGKRNFYRQFRAEFGTTPGAYRAAPQDPASDVERLPVASATTGTEPSGDGAAVESWCGARP
jgi:AraC-like DNA-binding protein